jgi:hypothetical protein
MPDPRIPDGSSLPGTSRTGFAQVSEPASPPELAPDSSAGTAPPAQSLSRAQIWLHRLLVLLFVFVCAAAGVLLVVLPWTPQWTDNHLLLRYPDLRTLVSHGFFRGLCSGLGLLDIWIGFSEAIHYHEDKIV